MVNSLGSGRIWVYLGPINLVIMAYAEVDVQISLGIKGDPTMWTGHEREWESTFTSFPSLLFQPHEISSVQFTLRNFSTDM